MSPQKNVKITRQGQEQYMVGEDSLWILEKATTTSKTESQSALIATNMAIWPRNVGRRKRKK